MSRKCLCVLGLLVLLAAPAHAADSALLQLLEALHEQGTIDAATYAAIRKAAIAEAGAPGEPAQAIAEAAPPEPVATPAPDVAAAAEPVEEDEDDGWPETHVKMGSKGLEVESEGGFSLALGGRLHVDSAWYGDDDTDMGNGSEIRRLRAEVEGTIWEDFEFKASIDFADDAVSLKSTYITYTGLDWFDIVVGRYKEPFGLEELGSANDTLLMERAALEAFAPQRHIGAGIESHGDHWTVAWGMFAGDDEFVDDENGDSGWSSTGRVTVAPLMSEKYVLHFGTAGGYRAYDRDAVFNFESRPESHVTNVRFVDTGDLTRIDHIGRWGGEFAALLGPVTLQSEYARAWVPRGSDTNLAFDGWYVLGGFVLTGERHEYKDKKGVIGDVIPRNPVGREGGFGAWEVAMRYSAIDLSDDDVRGGEQDILGAGLNWYLNENLRMMFNYLRVLDVRSSDEGFDGENPDIFQVRAQLDF